MSATRTTRTKACRKEGSASHFYDLKNPATNIYIKKQSQHCRGEEIKSDQHVKATQGYDLEMINKTFKPTVFFNLHRSRAIFQKSIKKKNRIDELGL